MNQIGKSALNFYFNIHSWFKCYQYNTLFCISFPQHPWLIPFIEVFTDIRRKKNAVKHVYRNIWPMAKMLNKLNVVFFFFSPSLCYGLLLFKSLFFLLLPFIMLLTVWYILWRGGSEFFHPTPSTMTYLVVFSVIDI